MRLPGEMPATTLDRDAGSCPGLDGTFDSAMFLSGAMSPTETTTRRSTTGPKKLILCFDGTAENFEGNAADSNVVKLYSKFDRTATGQLHYYQPGVGTYPANGYSHTPLFLGNAWNRIVQLFDQAFATSFNSHVMNGYRFLLRYYEEDDEIYIFGFSRGAFIARFLARFISQVGLLSRGNEQLVPFAYSNFLDYQLGTGRKDIESYLRKFTAAFCRHYNQNITDGRPPGVQAHFLGLFDCVNSISLLDMTNRTGKPPPVHGTARYIRHAVAVDERRVKFRAALLVQDTSAKGIADEDIKELWFPGCHVDVGGGVAPDKKNRGVGDHLRTLTGFGEQDHRRKAPVRKLQLSDIALKWMIDEIDMLPGESVKWNSQKDHFLDHYRRHIHEALDSRIHNSLAFGGDKLLNFFLWGFLEILPFKRWEYAQGEWRITRRPNYGKYRDIPPNAVFHRALAERLQHDGYYHPQNRVYTAESEGCTRLYQVNTDIVKDDDGHPFATAAPNTLKAKASKTGQIQVQFELYSTGKEVFDQDFEDNTYCAVEMSITENVPTETDSRSGLIV